MTAKPQSRPKSTPNKSEIAVEARGLIRSAQKAALASLEKTNGHPYASLITVASEPGGTPVFLISTLALHTRNIQNDPRVSILFDGTDGLGDPLQGGRVSVRGRAEITEDPVARQRFLARHPESAFYADFDDFAFYRLEMEGAHFVGGFGAIHDIAPDDLLIDVADAGALIDAEAGIIAHMNEDHSDAVRLYATRLLGADDGPWRFAGCDPEGCDLILGDKCLRLDFPERATDAKAVRVALVALAETARNKSD